jgi:hypothetical protein
MIFYSLDLYSTSLMCACVCMYAVEYYAYYIDIFIVLDCHKYVCIMYVQTIYCTIDYPLQKYTLTRTSALF